MLRRSVWLAAALTLGACAHAPVKPGAIARGDYTWTKTWGDWVVRQEMRRANVTGLSIAVVDDQTVVWAAGYGFADLKGHVPASPATVYRVGSVSKLFTVTAALQLVEQGRLNLDAPLTDVLPRFAVRSRFSGARAITMRDLLTHHSGLPSDLMKGMWTRRPEPIADAVARIADEDAAYPPGHVFAYSNLGMMVAGAAIQRIAGQDYADYMREAVLLPLGMTSSSFATSRLDRPEHAKPYRDGKEADEVALRDVPAGGLSTSVLDLARFTQMIFAEGRAGGRQLLKPESVAEMLRPQNAEVALDRGFPVGLGWMLAAVGGLDFEGAGPVAHHGGGTINYHAQVITLPQQRLAVIVLANSASAGRAVSRIAAQVLEAALEAKAGIKATHPQGVPFGGQISEDALSSWEGEYASGMGLIRISRSGKSLKADVLGRSFSLAPRSDGSLGIRTMLNLGDLGKMSFTRADASGRQVIFAGLGRNAVLIAEKLAPANVPAAWWKRLGKYAITNLGDDESLAERPALVKVDGRLMMEYSLPKLGASRIRVVLTPLSATEAIMAGVGRGMGETIRVESGAAGDEELRYGGYRLRKTR